MVCGLPQSSIGFPSHNIAAVVGVRVTCELAVSRWSEFSRNNSTHWFECNDVAVYSTSGIEFDRNYRRGRKCRLAVSNVDQGSSSRVCAYLLPERIHKLAEEDQHRIEEVARGTGVKPSACPCRVEKRNFLNSSLRKTYLSSSWRFSKKVLHAVHLKNGLRKLH